MSDFARSVVLDADSGEITVGGEPLPWFYGDAEPALVKDDEGNVIPAVRLSIACTDLLVISPSKVIDDAD